MIKAKAKAKKDGRVASEIVIVGDAQKIVFEAAAILASVLNALESKGYIVEGKTPEDIAHLIADIAVNGEEQEDDK